MKKVLQICLLVSFALSFQIMWGQNVYTFTTGGATGNIGPTQGQLNTAYTSTNLAGNVTSTGGIQRWVVPTTGNYQIEAFGGQGYGPFGGRGARMSGEFALTAGDTLKILVGQLAGPYLNFPATTYNHQFGGGGGSFVTYTNNTPLIVAGGGGGNHSTGYLPACDGQITTSGSVGAMGSTVSAGGTGGNGGLAAISADAGGGLLTNGAGIAGGFAFVNGGNGGIDEGTGGFGCGGGTSSWNNYRGGGGGGYSGGGAGNNGANCCAAGGGGGSFNAGTNQMNVAGVQTGDGSVIIRSLTLPPNDGGAYAILGIAPPVCVGNYPVEVTIKNYGSNQINPITVKWTVNGVPQPDSIITTVIDTVGGSLPDSIDVLLGNVSITAATNIKIWTTLPNNVADPSAANDTIEMNIAAPATVSAMVDNDVSCFGVSDGGATAMGAGGSPGYTYNWSNGGTTASISGVMAGAYSVVLTDLSGCTDSASVTIVEPTAIVVAASTFNVSCNGQSDGESQLSATGGTPGYSVLWSNSDTTWTISGLAAGDYSYVVTDAGGCTSSDTITIVEPAAIALTSSVIDETTAAPGNGSIDLTVAGGTPSFTYLWSNGAIIEDLTGLSAGTYFVTVTDANGCVDTLSAVVSLIVGNQTPMEGFNFTLAPNPSNGTFKVTVTGLSDDLSIEIIDLLGKKLVSIPNANPTSMIELDVDSGVYFVRVISGDKVMTKRLVLTR